MISSRQIEANRRNAQKSTGPRTPEGRAAVRNNAVTHALTAQNAVLPDESKEEFDEFFAAFEAEYQPAGPTETLLLTQMAMDAWHLQRLHAMETAFFELAMHDYAKFFAGEYKNTTPHQFHAYIFREDARGSDVLSRLGRYESRVHRHFYRSLHELQRLQSLRATPSISNSNPPPPTPHPDPVPLPSPALEKSNSFSKPDTTVPVSPSPNLPISPSPLPHSQLPQLHPEINHVTI